MKKSAAVFISLYLIFTISGIICNQFELCKGINNMCSVDCDCCYPKCSFSLFSLRSYCSDNTNLFTPISSFFNSKEQTGMCSYNTPENMTISDRMYNIYNLNAAHANLKPGTKVEVILHDKKLMVTINGYPSTKNGVILEFSRETAMVLNVVNDQEIPCKIIVPRLENSSFYKYLNIVLPYINIFSKLYNYFTRE